MNTTVNAPAPLPEDDEHPLVVALNIFAPGALSGVLTRADGRAGLGPEHEGGRGPAARMAGYGGNVTPASVDPGT